MRIKKMTILCAALLLLSCGTEPIDGYVNQYDDTGLRSPQSSVMSLEPGFTRYEAEDAMLYGSAAIDGTPPLYSGGRMVKGASNSINNPDNFPSNWSGKSYIKFLVFVPMDGVYLVDIVMNGPGAKKPLIVRVNDIENKAHELTGESDHTRVFAERFKLSLWKGLNFICITHAPPLYSDQWINIDCIDVSGGPVN